MGKWRDILREKAKIEDLSEDMQIVAETLGLDTALDMLENLAGMHIYIPRFGYRTVMKRVIRECMESGMDVKRISRELGISESFVRRLIKEILQERVTSGDSQ